MARFVALLRAVNVGGRRPVPMAALRALAGDLGLGDAATWVQSGNLVFSAGGGEGALAARIAAGVERRFGFPVDVVVRSRARWARYLAALPFRGEPRRIALFLPLAPPPAGAAAALEARGRKGERVAAAGDGVWIRFPEGIGASKLTAPVIDRLLGSPSTARNLRTVEAIRDLLGSRGPGAARSSLRGP